MAQLKPVLPPFRFACVEPGIYRSCLPSPNNERFLERLRLRTLLSLTPVEGRPWVWDYCGRKGIARHHFPTEVSKESVTLTTATVKTCLELLIDPRNHPILVHSTNGDAIVGLLIVCFRRLQLWPLPAAVAEYLRFSRAGEFSSEEEEFANALRLEIAVPPIVPNYLWGRGTPLLGTGSGGAPSDCRMTVDLADYPWPIGTLEELHRTHCCTLCRHMPFAKHPVMQFKFVSRAPPGNLATASASETDWTPTIQALAPGSARASTATTAEVRSVAASPPPSSAHDAHLPWSHRLAAPEIAERTSVQLDKSVSETPRPRLLRETPPWQAPVSRKTNHVRKALDPEEDEEEGQAEWVELSLSVRALALEAQGF
ncbi:protein-tyrosine-phosphatase [Tieghemiomyces parasiticus]|uniref:Protein-tyrosine-phosphatase n=1 Tax=Tieghemiomyces parasiticus TaxID=78921 RepID=A0A9W7ZPA5_9FUNG|nr:protein-tyrosine-phosphatase [Tieghemiomyces parasiticus]